MLKRVLLAYARWNKSIGYCQGFNMLAALILEVMEKSEPDALKVKWINPALKINVSKNATATGTCNS